MASCQIDGKAVSFTPDLLAVQLKASCFSTPGRALPQLCVTDSREWWPLRIELDTAGFICRPWGETEQKREWCRRDGRDFSLVRWRGLAESLRKQREMEREERKSIHSTSLLTTGLFFLMSRFSPFHFLLLSDARALGRIQLEAERSEMQVRGRDFFYYYFFYYWSFEISSKATPPKTQPHTTTAHLKILPFE